MRSIKTTFLLSLFFLILSCTSDDTEELTLSLEAELSIIHTAIFEVIQSDIEVLTYDIISDLEETDPSGEANTHVDDYIFYGRGGCRTESLDSDLNRVILDFGSGCTDDKGLTRAGKIIISYQFADDRLGNVMEVRTENYEFQGVEYSGLTTFTKIEGANQYNSYQIEFNELEFKIDIANLYQVSGARISNHPLVGGGPNQLMRIDNNQLFIDQNGQEIRTSTVTQTDYSSDCFSGDHILPYRGNTNILIDQSEYTLLFESGVTSQGLSYPCDNAFTIKITEDIKKEIDLSSFLSQ